MTVRSALNPVLWLCAIVAVPCAVLISIMDSAPIVLTYMAVGPVGTAIAGFAFLLLFDRDKLQSEDYQLRKSYMEMIEQKGDPQIIEAARVEIIENPEIIALPPSEADAE